MTASEIIAYFVAPLCMFSACLGLALWSNYADR